MRASTPSSVLLLLAGLLAAALAHCPEFMQCKDDSKMTKEEFKKFRECKTPADMSEPQLNFLKCMALKKKVIDESCTVAEGAGDGVGAAIDSKCEAMANSIGDMAGDDEEEGGKSGGGKKKWFQKMCEEERKEKLKANAKECIQQAVDAQAGKEGDDKCRAVTHAMASCFWTKMKQMRGQ